MADDNSPTGGFSYPGSAGDPFKDLFNGNPTLGANPTQGPVTSNSAPSSGNSGTESSASSDGGGVGSDASSSSADAADSGASTSSQSPSSSASSPSSTANSGISSPASGSDTSGMGSEGGGSWGGDMSITGGAAPDGRTSYSDPASGGLSSDTGPIGGLDGITGASDRTPVSLSNAGTSVADPLGSLKSALGISQPAPGATGTNFGTANSDPLASINAASWANEDVPAPDSIVDMGSIYNNPFRSPVGTLGEGLVSSKYDDRIAPTEGFVNASARRAPTGTEEDFLNEIVPGFDGPPVASNIPAAPEYDPLQDIQPPIAQPFNNTLVAQTGFPSGTQTAWGGGPPTTDVAQNDIGRPGSEMQLGGFDPLSSIKAAMGIASTDLPEDPRVGLPPGGFPPASQGVASLPPDPRVGLPPGGFPPAQPATASLPMDPRVASVPPGAFPASEIPRPADPLTALREAFGIETAAGRYPSRGNYQGYPAAAESILRATQTGPQSSEMTQNVAPDPGYEPPPDDTQMAQAELPMDPRVGLPNTGFPAGATIQPASAPPFRTAAAPDLPPGYAEQYFPNGIPGTEEVVPEEQGPPMPPDIQTADSGVPGTSENPIQTNQIEAPSQNDPPPTKMGGFLGGLADLLTRGRSGDTVTKDYNDWADMSPEQRQAWADRREAERNRADGGNARNDAQATENPDKAKIDELEAEIAALRELIEGRKKAAKRSKQQYGLIMRNYS